MCFPLTSLSTFPWLRHLGMMPQHETVTDWDLFYVCKMLIYTVKQEASLVNLEINIALFTPLLRSFPDFRGELDANLQCVQVEVVPRLHKAKANWQNKLFKTTTNSCFSPVGSLNPVLVCFFCLLCFGVFGLFLAQLLLACMLIPLENKLIRTLITGF